MSFVISAAFCGSWYWCSQTKMSRQAVVFDDDLM